MQRKVTKPGGEGAGLVRCAPPTGLNPPIQERLGFKQQKVTLEALENTEKYQEEGEDQLRCPRPETSSAKLPR